MKIIDAFWEKRNLKVDCKEIVFENVDQIADLQQNELILTSTEYVVVKVPVGRFDVNSYLENLGFNYIEGSINFQLNLSQAQLMPLQERLNKVVSYQVMDENDREGLFTEIDNGLFATDRIILDPFFSKEQAFNRYKNWIVDEIERGSEAFKIVYKGDSIGFFTFKNMGRDIFYPFLAGLYKKYETSGLGFTTLRKPIEEALKRDGKMISTYASTNNMPVIRAHSQQGFSINELHNVFIKHN